MARRLYALGLWSVAHRGRVVLAWLALLVVVGGLGVTLAGTPTTEFTVPGIESQRAQDLLLDQFPAVSGGTIRIVFQAAPGTTLADSAVAGEIASALSAATTIDGVIGAAPPTLSADSTIGYSDVLFQELASDVPESAKDALSGAMAPVRAAGLVVEFGGSASVNPVEIGGPAEVVGVVIAFVVLFLTLGSLLAAGLPLLTAAVGVAIGVLGVQFVSRFVEMTNTATVLATMVGLAVGIDYALFIVSRHREQITDPTMTVEESIGRAIGTAGSAVTFAGVTVIIALSALSVTGIPFLATMGLAAAATVLLAVLIALTLVPAVLSYAGDRLRPRGGSAVRPGGRVRRDPQPGRLGLAWGRGIARAPVVVLIVCVVALIALALPVRNLELGLPSNETQPVESTQHKSYELLTQGFGPGFNAALAVIVDAPDLPAGQRTALLGQLGDALRADPDIAAVAEPVLNEAQTVALLSVVPKTGPDDQTTTDLVNRLREQIRPLAESAGGTVYVAGATAAAIDVSAKLAAALPPFIVIIVVLAILLLAIAFRSLLVPLKAVLGFLLSIAASLGLVVWVFQDGHLGGLMSVASAAPIVSFVPVLLIGVLFGLAMDYEVFLVSRMREHFHHSDDAREAVVQGVGQSGRVVCAAALIMASVFGGFIFAADPIIKSIAFALTVGVLIDAFVVRMTIVPAVMILLGRRAWRLPNWVDRIIPDVDIEGASLPAHRSVTSSDPDRTVAQPAE